MAGVTAVVQRVGVSSQHLAWYGTKGMADANSSLPLGLPMYGAFGEKEFPKGLRVGRGYDASVERGVWKGPFGAKS